jgi:hypothetical protein
MNARIPRTLWRRRTAWAASMSERCRAARAPASDAIRGEYVLYHGRPRRRQRRDNPREIAPLAALGVQNAGSVLRFDCRLPRRSVRLWGEHGEARAGSLCPSVWIG